MLYLDVQDPDLFFLHIEMDLRVTLLIYGITHTSGVAKK